ncbi:hypothetical protein MRX96_007801 [Rhipicephalus microplus]
MHATMLKNPRFASAMCWMCECLVFRRALHGKIYRELENEHFHENFRNSALTHDVLDGTNIVSFCWRTVSIICGSAGSRGTTEPCSILSGRSMNKLTARELIQYLFFTNLQRRMVRHIKPVIEERLVSCFDELTVAEVGLACQSFFKSQELIEDKRLMARVVKTLEENAATADSVTISALAKALRYSRTAHDTSVWVKALTACEPSVVEWTPTTVAHVTTLATALKSYHPVLLDSAFTALDGRDANHSVEGDHKNTESCCTVQP